MQFSQTIQPMNTTESLSCASHGHFGPTQFAHRFPNPCCMPNCGTSLQIHPEFGKQTSRSTEGTWTASSTSWSTWWECSAHAYIQMFVYVCRTGQSNIWPSLLFDIVDLSLVWPFSKVFHISTLHLCGRAQSFGSMQWRYFASQMWIWQSWYGQTFSCWKWCHSWSNIIWFSTPRWNRKRWNFFTELWNICWL